MSSAMRLIKCCPLVKGFKAFELNIRTVKIAFKQTRCRPDSTDQRYSYYDSLRIIRLAVVKVSVRTMHNWKNGGNFNYNIQIFIL